VRLPAQLEERGKEGKGEGWDTVISANSQKTMSASSEPKCKRNRIRAAEEGKKRYHYPPGIKKGAIPLLPREL